MKYHHCPYPLPHQKTTRILYSYVWTYTCMIYMCSGFPLSPGYSSRCWREWDFFLDSILQCPLPSSRASLRVSSRSHVHHSTLSREGACVGVSHRPGDPSGCRAGEVNTWRALPCRDRAESEPRFLQGDWFIKPVSIRRDNSPPTEKAFFKHGQTFRAKDPALLCLCVLVVFRGELFLPYRRNGVLYLELLCHEKFFLGTFS